MASRNLKGLSSTQTILQHDTSPFDNSDKIQSNTLKRHPKMDLSKGDLLKLLSYLEGELQARDVVIATLKAEKAKQLLYQAKYGRFGLGDPFMALQRDSDNMKDSSFDETAIKLMYDNQLAQLENLIATQRKAQVKMREQLTSAEKRFHKATSELEDEKRKHAQDTAQGDDVTYMLEKERERLKQEVEFEKGQSKRLEKDLKKSLASLEEEKANSNKHKQVALMLIKERKKLEDVLLLEKHKRSTAESLLNSDKSKIRDIVDGLEEESKRSLQMEAVMEKQLSEFDVEREQLRNKFTREESRSNELQATVNALSVQLEALQLQLGEERAAVCATPQSIEIRSSVSPSKTKEGSREGSQLESSQLTAAPYRKPQTPAKPCLGSGTGQLELNPISGTTVYAMPSGAKVSVHVGGTGNTPRKPTGVGRGTPPPIPPNKPVLASPLPGALREGNTRAVSPKPVPPPKVGITLNKDRLGFGSTDGQGERQTGSKPVHIPVNQVNVVSNQAGGVRERPPVQENSPIRKTTQSLAVEQGANTGVNPPLLDFLGQEMADLQQVISSMGSGESCTYSVDFNSSSSPSLLHHFASCGNTPQLLSLLSDASVDPNQPLHDGTTPLHSAVDGGHEDCTLTLLEHKAYANSVRGDLITPVHIAAGAGHYQCLKHLLNHHGNVNQPDHGNWTPLHWAATNGSLNCCQLLLDSGANIRLTTNEGWTPLHAAVNSGHTEVLKLLLNHVKNSGIPGHYHIPNANHTKINSLNKLPENDKGSDLSHEENDVVCQNIKSALSMESRLNDTAMLHSVVNTADHNGWTIAHLAALRQSQDCLEVIIKICAVDLMRGDNWGRTVLELASVPCKDYLTQIANKNYQSCAVCIDITTPSDVSAHLIGLGSEVIIGSIQVSHDISWNELEEMVSDLLSAYFKNLDSGIKTRKTTRLEPDPSHQLFTLGLSPASVKFLHIGLYSWSPGCAFDRTPYEIMNNNNSYKVKVQLGGGESCADRASYESLIPVITVQNYIRLIEQYRSVVFYGPVGSGKSLLADRLAHCIQVKEESLGHDVDLIQVTCTENFTHKHLVDLLIDKGCIVQSEGNADNLKRSAPILILNELDKINIGEVFGDLLASLEHRGSYSAFQLKGPDSTVCTYHFVEDFYLIATMDRTRSTGLELSVQQRFRWIHFRVDTEPTKHLLARHLYRRLLHSFAGHQPCVENPVYKAVEWVVCVWQRINDGLAKLGLPEVVFGPGLFFDCPIIPADPLQTLHWLREIWNSTIAPVVTDAVVKGTGAEATQGGQQKVANTALYVLMQRSLMAGCPLTGSEKENYLCVFEGSNELDIPIRSRSHSSSDIFISPSSPLSPTVQLKSILAVTSPHTREHHKRHSWLQTSKQSVSRTGTSNGDLPHKIPSTRMASNKSASDADLTASLPKVRRLEIRTPNLQAPVGSRIPNCSTSPDSTKFVSKDSDCQFTFSPTNSPVENPFTTTTTSPSTFTTKLPRAVTVFKTTLSSVGEKSDNLEQTETTKKKSANHSPKLRLSSPKHYHPKKAAHLVKEGEGQIEATPVTSVEAPKAKSLKRDSPVHFDTALHWYTPDNTSARLVEPTAPFSNVMKSSSVQSDKSVMRVEAGPCLTAPEQSTNTRVFLLSGHKHNPSQSFTQDNRDSDIYSIPSECGTILPAGEITQPVTEKKLTFSPGRTEGNSAMEALAKVLQDEERVSLC